MRDRVFGARPNNFFYGGVCDFYANLISGTAFASALLNPSSIAIRSGHCVLECPTGVCLLFVKRLFWLLRSLRLRGESCIAGGAMCRWLSLFFRPFPLVQCKSFGYDPSLFMASGLSLGLGHVMGSRPVFVLKTVLCFAPVPAKGFAMGAPSTNTKTGMGPVPPGVWKMGLYSPLWPCPIPCPEGLCSGYTPGSGVMHLGLTSPLSKCLFLGFFMLPSVLPTVGFTFVTVHKFVVCLTVGPPTVPVFLGKMI